METLIDPKDITNYNRTDVELESFWIFCILVAGKNSDTTARLVTKLLKNRGDKTPFEFIRSLKLTELHNYLTAHKTGQLRHRYARCAATAAKDPAQRDQKAPPSLGAG